MARIKNVSGVPMLIQPSDGRPVIRAGVRETVDVPDDMAEELLARPRQWAAAGKGSGRGRASSRRSGRQVDGDSPDPVPTKN